MTKNQSMFVFVTGLLLTFGAVGGIEFATDEQLLASMILACVGLVTMYVGTLGMRNSEFY